MKILYHHRTRAEDAQGIHIQEIINAFRKLGHYVEVAGVISSEGTQNQPDNDSLISRFAARVPHRIYELLEILYNIYGFYLLRKKILLLRPDLIYERYALYTFAGVLASKLFHIPLLLEVNAPLSYEKFRYSKLFLTRVAKLLERWICSNAHKTIVVSTPMKNILKEIGVPDHKMTVISNGINPENFNTSVKGNHIRNKYNLNDKIVLGFVGWFRKWHGLEELLRIYMSCGMLPKNIHLLLVGDGPAFEAIKLFARENGILDKGVTFTGAVSLLDIPQHIAAFDLALQPDVTDYASPIKLFEYMAMGKGIIAPDKENIKEILKEDYKGLFKAGDWEHMGKTILFFAQSKDKTHKLGKQAKDILQENKYYWMENARRSLALLA